MLLNGLRNDDYIIYHNHLLLQGIVTAPILFAMEEFPQLHAIVYQGFDSPENIEIVSICNQPMNRICEFASFTF